MRTKVIAHISIGHAESLFRQIGCFNKMTENVIKTADKMNFSKDDKIIVLGAGYDGRVTFITEPGAACNAKIIYKEPADPDGLRDTKIAGSDGLVKLIWRVAPNTPTGIESLLTMTCEFGGDTVSKRILIPIR